MKSLLVIMNFAGLLLIPVCGVASGSGKSRKIVVSVVKYVENNLQTLSSFEAVSYESDTYRTLLERVSKEGESGEYGEQHLIDQLGKSFSQKPVSDLQQHLDDEASIFLLKGQLKQDCRQNQPDRRVIRLVTAKRNSCCFIQ